ncbi:hypothetical protein RRG08_027918 [Elysia crispata]|uniref:Uncharacterized protein n=1 Tax=Elysia crispata TaxID=231223 RepID=A0AAE1DU30_9GAST|nr:hypothetical protein RRG08_027918 [Elysia crispata]
MQGNSVTTVFEALCSIEHLDHYNNNSVRESWEKCPSAPQPTVQIEIQIPLTLESISPCPTRTSKTQAIADTGCQSCTSILTQLGLDTSHLTPTSMKMRAANQDLIEIQEQVKAGLDQNNELSILEPVPIETPVSRCHQMVCAKKSEKLRQTVDFQALNRHATRDMCHTQLPLLPGIVCVVKGTFHLVMPDEIISDIMNKTKVIDDTVMWSQSIEDSFFQTAKFLVGEAEHLHLPDDATPISTNFSHPTLPQDFLIAIKAQPENPTLHSDEENSLGGIG